MLDTLDQLLVPRCFFSLHSVHVHSLYVSDSIIRHPLCHGENTLGLELHQFSEWMIRNKKKKITLPCIQIAYFFYCSPDLSSYAKWNRVKRKTEKRSKRQRKGKNEYTAATLKTRNLFKMRMQRSFFFFTMLQVAFSVCWFDLLMLRCWCWCMM